MNIHNDYPIVGYRFLVVIFSAGIPNPIDIWFQEVDGLKISREIKRENGMTTLGKELPKQTLTLKRGVVSRVSPLVISQILENELWDTRLLRKDILVSVLNENYIPVSNWIIPNAFLSGWDWNGINAKSNEVLIESMQFDYCSLKYIPIPQSL
ncbi:T4-like virus tail tube protein gp19 [Vibrio aerogenes CECT 7868]|uniref:T4-like virus tail tube protein gp19 n=1 Tax=Vibrio aerogenes CECT 7868 TaxID=1216006 RepID=A0A1M5Z673_9VIBR|nr:phage tail protein [Vibrio aerogenes]SHI19710.1 T4-like virus tail tube protein gp19 [Vibrio aerogenes CECT 7868]